MDNLKTNDKAHPLNICVQNRLKLLFSTVHCIYKHEDDASGGGVYIVLSIL